MRGDSVVAKAVNGCTGKTLESRERLRQKKNTREGEQEREVSLGSVFPLSTGCFFFMTVMHSDNQQRPMNETSVQLNKQQQI